MPQKLMKEYKKEISYNILKLKDFLHNKVAGLLFTAKLSRNFPGDANSGYDSVSHKTD